jgi:hypothetical protein
MGADVIVAMGAEQMIGALVDAAAAGTPSPNLVEGHAPPKSRPSVQPQIFSSATLRVALYFLDVLIKYKGRQDANHKNNGERCKAF